MIEIIEKEPYYDNSMFTGQCQMYPTYMLKDGKEFFMFNRREPDDKWRLAENEERKRQLIENDGAFFMFHGYYENPMDMLKEIAKRQHSFTEPDNVFYTTIENEGVLDFHGNRREVSAAFFYRIYDTAMVEKVQAVVDLINHKEWDKALMRLSHFDERKEQQKKVKEKGEDFNGR